jgi:histidinol-phosphate aminotransferase
MAPYSPPSAGREGRIRLDFNENTVGCSPRVLRALRRYMTRDRLATYPEYDTARPLFAQAFGRAPEETLITNGTDEAIQLVVNTFVEAGQRVVVSEPTFTMYRFYASVAGAQAIDVPPGDDFRFPVEAVRAELRRNGARIVFAANPNNPTGTAVPANSLAGLVEEFHDILFFIDEAYFEFYGETALPLVARHANLLVARTFSKAFGLAGLRVGCLFGGAETAAHLRKAQPPYSVNALALVAALEAVGDADYTRRYVAGVLRSRAALGRALARRGIPYIPSEANFVLARFGGRAAAVKNGLRDRGILARDRGYEIPGSVRFTLGTPQQTRLLIRALDEVLAEGGIEGLRR